MYVHSLYGLTVASPRELPAPYAAGKPDLTITETHDRPAAKSQLDGFSYNVNPDNSVFVSWCDLFDFTVNADGSAITVHAGAHWHNEPVYMYLIGQVISVALLQKRVESLHASAVELNGRATAIVGDCGAGKSTLTAALVAAGARLVTDDLLVTRRNGSGTVTLSGARRLKLDPATAEHVGLTAESTPMDDGSGKAVYYIGADSFADASVPLRRMIVLKPFAEKLALTRLDAMRAVRAVISATFNPLQTDARRLEHLLSDARDMCATLPVYELAVPRDLRAIGDAVDLIMQN